MLMMYLRGIWLINILFYYRSLLNILYVYIMFPSCQINKRSLACTVCLLEYLYCLCIRQILSSSYWCHSVCHFLVFKSVAIGDWIVLMINSSGQRVLFEEKEFWCLCYRDSNIYCLYWLWCSVQQTVIVVTFDILLFFTHITIFTKFIISYIFISMKILQSNVINLQLKNM